MLFAKTLPLLAGALAVEAALGYPAPLYRRIGHPVTWMGGLLGRLDRRLNREADAFAARRRAGVVALLVLLVVTGAAALAITLAVAWLAPSALLQTAVLSVLASSLFAQRSLAEHVGAVATALDGGGLAAGRKAVSLIVGRNPDVLDQAGVARAAIESLAENFSDGIVAPAFWTAMAGLMGGALYKAANTADSMIGHGSPRYAAFGWAAARFDDVVNLPASRLAAAWLIVAAALTPGASPKQAWRALRRDAGRHRSPNAGWPEAAMAGALGLALAGPRVYGTELVSDALMGDGRRDAGAADIRRALRLYRTACAVQWGVVMLLAIGLNAPG